MRKTIKLLFIFISLIYFNGKSANRYWVGGSGTWDNTSTANWSASDGGPAGASVPGTGDDVFFNSNSGLSGATVITSTGATCNTLTWSSTVGTLSISSSTSVNGDFTWSGAGGTFSGSSALSIKGSYTLNTLSTYSYTGTITFNGTSIGKTINSGGKSLSNTINFNGTGGVWTLASNLTMTSYISMSAGTLNFSSFTVNISSFIFQSNGTIDFGTSTGNSVQIFSISGGTLNLGTGTTSTKSFDVTAGNLNFGTSSITVTGYSSQSFVDFEISSGVTVSGTPTVSFTAANNSATAPIDIYMGSKTISTITLPSTSYPIYFYDGGTITNNFTINAGNFIILESTKTFTINGTVTATGTCSNYISIIASYGGSAATLTAGAPESWNYVQMKDITETAGGSSITCTNCVNAGTNTNITFTTPRTGTTIYWIGNGANGTGSWSSGNSWSSISSNGAALTCVPTLVDDVVFDATSFDAAGRTVTVDANMSYASMTWSSIVNSPTLTNSSSYKTVTTGNIILNSGIGTFTNSGEIIFHGSGNHKIKCASKTLTSGNVTFQGTGNYYLEDDAYFGTLNLVTGTLDHQNQAGTTSYDMYVQSDWNVASTGNSYNNRSKTVTFNSSNDSYINSSVYSFYNLTVNKTSSTSDVYTGANVVITNQLLISLGIYYNWLSYTTTINSGGTLIVNGSNAKLYVSSGTVSYGDNSTSNLVLQAGTIEIAGGIFNAGVTNTNTTTVLNIGNASGTGDATLLISGGTLNVADKLHIKSDGIFNVTSGTINIKATTNSIGTATSKWVIDASGEFKQSGGTINVLGAYDNTNSNPAIAFNSSAITTAGNFTAGTIVLQSTTTGVTTGYFVNWGGETIFNLTASTSGATYTQLTNSIVIKGTMTINTGVTYAAAGLAMSIATNWSNNGTFIPSSNTVTFNGTSTLTTGGSGAGKGFYNVILNGTSATLAGDIDISNAFTITAGTWDVSATNYTMYVAGNWSNSGTFTPRSGTVTFDGTSTITTGGTGAGKIFYNVTLNGTSGTLAGNMDIDNNFTLIAGTWDVSASNYSMNIGDDFVNIGGTFTCRAGTVTFDGIGTQYVNVTSAGGSTPRNADITFYNIIINGTDVKIYYDSSNSRVINMNNFTINSTMQCSIFGI